MLIVLLLACKGDYPATCEEAAKYTPEAVIGTGAERFEAVTEGQDVAMDYGDQGGQHVWGAVRARGIAASKRLGESSPLVDFTVTREDEVLAQANWEMPFDDGGDGWVEHAGEAVQFFWGLDTGEDAVPLAGSAVTLAVSIEDTCGTVVEDSAGIVLR